MDVVRDAPVRAGGRLGGRAAVAALGQRGRTTRIPDAVRAPEKAEMRELALRGGPWTEALPTVVAPTAGTPRHTSASRYTTSVSWGRASQQSGDLVPRLLENE